MLKLMKSIEGACACGKCHAFGSEVISGKGLLANAAEYVCRLGGSRPYVICDENTHAAAGARLESVLEHAGMEYSLYMFPCSPLPNEEYIGLATDNKPDRCDIVIAVGSGVINDIGKLVSLHYGLPYIIFATAPSMDGYASSTSSVVIGGLKKSLPSHCADIIVGDVDVLKTAPTRMAVSGIGDMLAKYISICDWRISNIITGEYYCERIAQLVRDALAACTENIEGLLASDDDAVQKAFDALCVSSVAMTYAGASRPASGVEHYISHIIDMRNEEFGTPAELHGIQCGIATLIAARLYGVILNTEPDRERALAHAAAFSYDERKEALRALLGKGAEAMIELEAREGKFSADAHRERLEVIISNFDKIKQVIREEIPSPEYLDSLACRLGLEKDYAYIGLGTEDVQNAFIFSGDIRDKYVLSRLFWDLGITDLALDVIE